MSAYYGDKSSQIPSWDALDADDDQDIVDNSEVGDQSMQAFWALLTTVCLRSARSCPLLYRRLPLDADASTGH